MLATPSPSLFCSPHFQLRRLQIYPLPSTVTLIPETRHRLPLPRLPLRAKFKDLDTDNAPPPPPSISLPVDSGEITAEQTQDLDQDSDLPSDLEGAIRQSSEACAAFISSGGMRAMVELLIPQLQFLDAEGAQGELWELSRIFLETLIEATGIQKVRAIFPDAGAAALLKYQWGDANFGFASLSDRKPVEDEDEVVVMLVPDYQMLEYVERIASLLSDEPPRPLIMWNPRLVSEDVGVGFNARRLRKDFLSTFSVVYSMRPFPSGATFRCYPGMWKVFYDDVNRPNRYLLAKEQPTRPNATDIEQIFGAFSEKPSEEPSFLGRAMGIFTSLNRFLRAISRDSRVYISMVKPREGGVSANWDSNEVTIFCDLCIKEIGLGNRPTTHFSKDGWKNLISAFKERTGKSYDRMQMKNKWDHLKKDWKLWRELKLGATGLGWDAEKRTIAASDKWWEDKIKVVPGAKKFRHSGIAPELEDKLDIMFGQVVAAGPSDLQRRAEEADMADEDLQVQPHSRDDTTGHTSTNIATGSTSTGKRRRIVKGKAVGQSFINELRDSVISVKPPPPVTIKDVVELICQNEDIRGERPFYYFALNHMKDKNNREIFMTIPEQDRIWWLKSAFDSAHL